MTEATPTSQDARRAAPPSSALHERALHQRGGRRRTAITRTRSALSWTDLSRSLRDCAFSDMSGGEAVAELERAFAEAFGFSSAVAVSSVRFGLHWTLGELALPRGSEVLCTPITIAGVIDAVVAAGLVPVFVDIGLDGFSPDLSQARQRLSRKTRALLLTHLWGLAADSPAARAFCDEHGLHLLEDASQCLGARIAGDATGSFGHVGVFSFSATKTINTFHGAMLVSADDELAVRLRRERDKLPPPRLRTMLSWIAAEVMLKAVFDPVAGVTPASIPVTIAHRFGLRDFSRVTARPDPHRSEAMIAALGCGFADLQARAGLAALTLHASRQERRSRIAAKLRTALAPAGLHFGNILPGSQPNDWVTVAFHPRAAELRRRLWLDARVDTATPSLDLCSALYADHAATPVAARLLDSALYLPNYPELEDADIDAIIAAVTRAAELLR